MGVDAMLEGLDLVKSGVIIKHDRRLDVGTYEGWFGKKLNLIGQHPLVGYTTRYVRPTRPLGHGRCSGQELKIYDGAGCWDRYTR